jgi:hypothetical protein
MDDSRDGQALVVRMTDDRAHGSDTDRPPVDQPFRL